MKLKIIIFLMIGLSSSFLSYGQREEIVKNTQTEENLIDLPTWIGSSEVEIIQKIEAQEKIDWSDDIQLAISYSQLDAEKSKIETLIKKALQANTNDSCRILSFTLENRPEWNITKKYKELVEEQLEVYKCPES